MFVRKVPSLRALLRATGFSVAVSFAIPSNAAYADAEGLDHLVSHVADRLSANEQAALEAIPDIDRRLLALRAYLKTGRRVEARWSWTREEIERYSKSSEYSQLLQDLAAVRAAFESKNPGYTLYANTEVRSLDTQLQRWNSNAGVGATAKSLRSHVDKSLRGTSTDAKANHLRELLATWRPSPVAPLAAPGLSMHGRMRAIDFQIMRNGRIVAATELRAVQREWDAPGWTDRLKQAVVAAGARFEGPLQSPDEPWHYEYVGTGHREAKGRDARIVR